MNKTPCFRECEEECNFSNSTFWALLIISLVAFCLAQIENLHNLPKLKDNLLRINNELKTVINSQSLK